MQWCVLVRMAKPLRSSPTPSMNHISQSGLLRSSSWAISRPVNLSSWVSLPGTGKAV